MKKKLTVCMLLMLVCVASVTAKKKVTKQDLWPDGSPVAAWFSDTSRVDVTMLGKQYDVTKYGVRNYSEQVQTEKIAKTEGKNRRDSPNRRRKYPKKMREQVC
jgi:hypothetical protein